MDNSGRRGSYPIQTSEFTPYTTTTDCKSVDEQPTEFPASIRALKDSRHTNTHERTIVVCLDGTGDRFDNDNSNVVHFVSCLKKHTPNQQITYYQSGIGTYGKGGLKYGIGAAADMAVGSGLGIHIKDAYRFLMQNYCEGDKICLLGFSRGAYTVRCLAGMLHKVGLLPASNGAQVNFAYKFFKDDSEDGWKMSADFKRTFCTNVNVYFLGLWDCVASVGFIPRKLPFSKSPTNSIHYFRHAMALDEHRSKFEVCQWQHQNPDAQRRNTIDNTPGAQMKRGIKRTGLLSCFGPKKPPKMAETNGTNGEFDEKSVRLALNGGGKLRPAVDQDKFEMLFDKIDATRQQHHKVETDALEVWFMGAHADVGGGAVANEKRHKLSQIPLRWMLRQCFECDTGILFDIAALCEQGLDVHNLYPVYKAPTIQSIGPPPTLMEKYEAEALPKLRHRSALLNIRGEGDALEGIDERDLEYLHLPECTEDHFDCRARVNDQLLDAKGWWVLEFWPVKIRVLGPGGEGWEKKVRLNMGRHRAIREDEPRMHWTVRHLVDEGKYTIKGRVDRSTAWKVVT